MPGMQPKPNHPKNNVYDVTIIGAGPTGLFGAFYAGMREMSCKIIEALPEVGGQLAVLYPEKWIYDAPGYPKILAKDLVRNLWEQASRWNPTLCLDERVTMLRVGEDSPMVLETDKGVHYTRTVIICAGVGAFSPNKLKNETVERFEGRGVYYFVKDKSPFRGKRLLIVGGGDSAVDWALNLKDYAREITLIHRRDQFRAHPASVTELMSSSVNVMLYHELKEIRGDDHIESVVVFDNRTGAETILNVDYVLLNLGFKADLGPIKEWGLEQQAKRYIKVNCRQETSIPGVYAAGDVAAHPDVEPLNLIAIGYAQAAVAVNYAYTYLHPEAKVFPGHSSEMRL